MFPGFSDSVVNSHALLAFNIGLVLQKKTHTSRGRHRVLKLYVESSIDPTTSSLLSSSKSLVGYKLYSIHQRLILFKLQHPLINTMVSENGSLKRKITEKNDDENVALILGVILTMLKTRWREPTPLHETPKPTP